MAANDHTLQNDAADEFNSSWVGQDKIWYSQGSAFRINFLDCQ